MYEAKISRGVRVKGDVPIPRPGVGDMHIPPPNYLNTVLNFTHKYILRILSVHFPVVRTMLVFICRQMWPPVTSS